MSRLLLSTYDAASISIHSGARKRLKRLPDLAAFRASIKVKGRSLTDELIAMREEERR